MFCMKECLKKNKILSTTFCTTLMISENGLDFFVFAKKNKFYATNKLAHTQPHT